MPEKSMTARMEEIMASRRPRKRWTVQLEEDLNIKGIRNWHAVARDVQECRKTVLEAKVHNGGQC
jgi:hypothetical protein